MELLERDEALATLVEAHVSAGRGDGRVVVVSGEPGIGKTALVGAFLQTLGVETTVLQGTCDNLSIPRPLGPFSDFVGYVSAPLEAAITSGAPPQQLHPLLYAELDVRSRTTVVVVEDAHWADDATLDALRFLARRVASVPAVLVLTARTGEMPPEHPLQAMLGEIAAAGASFVELAPLSGQAVARLAGDAAGEIGALTGGNPFFVSELLREREGGGVPATVAHAVVGRAARLDPDARRLVELVAVVPRRVRTAVLDQALPDWPHAAAEAERRYLLDVTPRYVAFRHELARTAILESLPAATRRAHHAQVLQALLATGADAADLVHHAEAAGAEDVVADNVLVAARRAAALHSSREAYAHYHRALDFIDREAPHGRATMLEELAVAAQLVGRFPDAVAAVDRAAAIWEELGERESVARCLRLRSRLHWFTGDGTRSREDAERVVAILEPLGDSRELAAAYGLLARLAMLADQGDEARLFAGRAERLAVALGDEAIQLGALVTLGSLQVQVDPDPGPLVEAHAVSAERGDRQEGVVALGNLGYALIGWGLARAARPHLDRAIAEAEDHELYHLAPRMRAARTWLDLRAGDWELAERTALADARVGGAVSGLLAEAVLAELAVRRGDADAGERLAALQRGAELAGDAHWLVRVLDLLVDRALNAGAPPPRDVLEELRRRAPPRGQLALRLAAAAALCGFEVDFDAIDASPYSHVAARDWRAAADGFGAEGWPYDRALMLSFLDGAEALAEALHIARTLGAAPLERRVTGRLRSLGHRVPRGPYAEARTNAAALTGRQLEVLALVAAGRTNAEIADALVVTVRTAEHHVAAVLRKLGASSRGDAARRAAELAIDLPDARAG